MRQRLGWSRLLGWIYAATARILGRRPVCIFRKKFPVERTLVIPRLGNPGESRRLAVASTGRDDTFHVWTNSIWRGVFTWNGSRRRRVLARTRLQGSRWQFASYRPVSRLWACGRRDQRAYLRSFLHSRDLEWILNGWEDLTLNRSGCFIRRKQRESYDRSIAFHFVLVQITQIFFCLSFLSRDVYVLFSRH